AMDLTELESFVAVCRAGSFTEAARQRQLSQPGVSRHVQRLEQDLGVRLFEREHHSLSLTPGGVKLLAYAEETLARHRHFLQAIQDRHEALAGELRIAASSTPGECLLPTLLASFTGAYPDVRPQLFIADSSAVIEEVAQRQWELGFVGVDISRRNLTYDVIGQDEVILVVPRGHAFAGRGQIAAMELEGQPMIEREGGSGTLRAFKTALAQSGTPAPRYRTVMVLNSAHAILSAVHNGLGLGVVSSLEFEQHGFERVHKVRIADLPLKRDLYMVRTKTRPLSPAATAFAAWVLQTTQGRPQALPPIIGEG
ncbi:MAG: selenium metabolism-associated LysR family transcriptional regulator, partial [Dehalococcoidia bacterium]